MGGGGVEDKGELEVAGGVGTRFRQPVEPAAAGGVAPEKNLGVSYLIFFDFLWKI